LPPRAGSAEAAAVIWSWGERESAPAAPASRIRLRGLLQALATGAAGTALYFFWSELVGYFVLGLAVALGLSALISPTGLFAGFQNLFAALGRWTGRVLTLVLMAVIFVLFFLPFGKLFRRGRRDRMRRWLEPEARSYWEPHSGPTASSSSRERQY
jgi:hypothetical protein